MSVISDTWSGNRAPVTKRSARQVKSQNIQIIQPWSETAAKRLRTELEPERIILFGLWAREEAQSHEAQSHEAQSHEAQSH